MPTYDFFRENIARYEFIKKFSNGKILDITFGKSLSYHAAQILLEGNATEVWHCDISNNPCSFEKRTITGKQTIQFELIKKQIPEKFFDCVISTESIQYESGNFNTLDKMLNVLKDSGILIILVTNKDISSQVNFRTNYDLPQKEFLKDEFEKILKRKFSNVEIFSQRLINKNDLKQKKLYSFHRFQTKIQLLLKHLLLKLDSKQKLYMKFMQPMRQTNNQKLKLNDAINYDPIIFQKTHSSLFFIGVCSKKILTH